MNHEPAKLTIDNEAAICMENYHKDTARNRNVVHQFNYVRQGTT